jgi:RNA polymerase sigma factor (sigma-70 family)
LKWSDAKLDELARQLAYTPAGKRRQQLDAALELLAEIDPEEQYPWDYILYTLTGYKAREDSHITLSGRGLLVDLPSLIEYISSTIEIKADEAGEPILTLDQVTARFGVSSKTIQRWRRQGLPAMRYVFADGVRRVGFRPSQIERFSRRHARRLADAARYRQIPESERAQIIARARRMSAKCHCCLKLISRRIARHTGRSPETIRDIIRRHDAENPTRAVFPESPARLTDADRQIIVECHRRGISIDCLAKRYCRTPQSIEEIVSQHRARQVKSLPIRFVPNPLFEHPDADTIILNDLPAKARAQTADEPLEEGGERYLLRRPGNLPPYLQDAFRQPIMAQPLVTDAFRRMNYLRFKAWRRQLDIDPMRASEDQLQAVESLLAEADSIRNQILQSHLRIVVLVARKHCQSNENLPELISDGNLWLMRAADSFDFSRNVRFSTYLSYALMKNYAHRFGSPTSGANRLLISQDDLLDQLGAPAEQSVPDAVDMLQMQGRLLDALAQLPERERALLARHYGLEAGSPPESLTQIAERMGVTKARVRQIEVKALAKLRSILESRDETDGTTAQDSIIANAIRVGTNSVHE